jgi:hypothetical protein
MVTIFKDMCTDFLLLQATEKAIPIGQKAGKW